MGSLCLHRDVAWLGDCDSGCLALAELLGWKVLPPTHKFWGVLLLPQTLVGRP